MSDGPSATLAQREAGATASLLNGFWGNGRPTVEAPPRSAHLPLEPPPRAPAGLPSVFRRNVGGSYGARTAQNSLVHAENYVALRHLRSSLLGRVKCIYIDPPYNNKDRYRYYRDNRRHDEWLTMMANRLIGMKPLLAPDGSIWISIDDREMHYLKVLADRVLGRENFVSTIIWQQRTTRENRRAFSNDHEYVLVYASDSRAFQNSRNLLPPTAELLARYKNPDGDPRGPWQSISANVQNGHATSAQYYCIVAPNGKRHNPPEGRCWVYAEAKMQGEIEAGNIWFGRDGNGVPRIKKFLRKARLGLAPNTLWTAQDVGTTDEAKKQLIHLFPNAHPFDTPKPERLISRILEIATNPGDLVLDAFLGSGTTAAVAHKMQRRYIGIEQGDHLLTHCVPRMRMVVDGEKSGVSPMYEWKGGGGFTVYELDR